MKTKKFKIKNQYGETISRHKTLDTANAKMRKIDNIRHTIYATDVDWLSGNQYALQGYNFQLTGSKK